MKLLYKYYKRQYHRLLYTVDNLQEKCSRVGMLV